MLHQKLRVGMHRVDLPRACRRKRRDRESRRQSSHYQPLLHCCLLRMVSENWNPMRAANRLPPRASISPPTKFHVWVSDRAEVYTGFPTGQHPELSPPPFLVFVIPGGGVPRFCFCAKRRDTQSRNLSSVFVGYTARHDC